MEDKRVDGIEQDATAFMAGGGISGALMRSVDWARTPLGPIEVWPASLKTTVGTLLHSRHPMFLWWGPDLIQFYNDAYLPSFGFGKHPAAMGQRGVDYWTYGYSPVFDEHGDVGGTLVVCTETTSRVVVFAAKPIVSARSREIRSRRPARMWPSSISAFR